MASATTAMAATRRPASAPPSFAPIGVVSASSSATGSSPDWSTATRLLARSGRALLRQAAVRAADRHGDVSVGDRLADARRNDERVVQIDRNRLPDVGGRRRRERVGARLVHGEVHDGVAVLPVADRSRVDVIALEHDVARRIDDLHMADRAERLGERVSRSSRWGTRCGFRSRPNGPRWRRHSPWRSGARAGSPRRRPRSSALASSAVYSAA